MLERPRPLQRPAAHPSGLFVCAMLQTFNVQLHESVFGLLNGEIVNALAPDHLARANTKIMNESL